MRQIILKNNIAPRALVLTAEEQAIVDKVHKETKWHLQMVQQGLLVYVHWTSPDGVGHADNKIPRDGVLPYLTGIFTGARYLWHSF